MADAVPLEKVPPQEAPPQEAPLQDDEIGEEHTEQMEKDEEDDILRKLFSGDLMDPSLLHSFKTHITAKIWFGEERDMLRCFCHTNKLLEWTYEKNQPT